MRLACVILLLCASISAATTRYISPSGKDSHSCSKSASPSTPKKSFASAFGCMVAGDTFVLEDGIYSAKTGTGIINCTEAAPSGCPVSGVSASAMITIQAENCGGAIIEGSDAGWKAKNLYLGKAARKSSYVRLRCLRFETGQNVIGYNTSHIYVSETGFHSSRNSVGAVCSIGSNDGDWGNSYILIEDSWCWGNERVVAIIYRSDHVVWRRVVIRNDGCTGVTSDQSCNSSGNSMVGITTYNSDHVSLQNVISLDNILGPNGRAGAGDFQTAQHNNFPFRVGANEWLGIISLNSAFNLINLETDANTGASTEFDPMFKVKDAVAITHDNTGQAGFNIDVNGGAIGRSSYTFDVENVTVYRGADPSLDLFRVSPKLKPAIDASILKNINVWGQGRFGINSIKLADCVNAYGAAKLFNQTTPTRATNLDPGKIVLFPPRFPSGSELDAPCGPKGADVMKQYGVTGTFYGDPGFNTLTSNDLWPWPNEARIRKEMCATVNRGWCASPRSLTEYVWEYLGNPVPRTGSNTPEK